MAVACSNAPHAVLSGSIDNGTGFVRYGQTLVYTAIVRNTGTAAANDVPVAGAVSAALDGAADPSCTVQGGASCGNAGSGGFNDSVDLPIGGQVTYIVQVPVRAVTPKPWPASASAPMPAKSAWSMTSSCCSATGLKRTDASHRRWRVASVARCR